MFNFQDNPDSIGFSNFESQLYDIMRSNEIQAFGALSRNTGMTSSLRNNAHGHGFQCRASYF